MKKGLCLFLAFIMLFSFACAEEAVGEAAMEEAAAEQPADLLSLWDRGETAAWAASGIPISDGILLTSLIVKDIPAERLVISDGTRQWGAAAVIPDEEDGFAVVFYNPADVPARYGVWPLMPLGDSVSAASCRVYYGDSEGSRILRGVTEAEEISWQGKRCYLLSLTGPAPAGSAVLTADNQLAGIVTAEWADGVNRVLVLPAEGIAWGVTGVAGLLAELPAWAEPPEGLTVSMVKNRVTFDWSAMTMPETKDGEQVWMVLMDTGNNYLTSFPADMEERGLSVLLTPGRFYIMGPVVSADHPSELPASYVPVYVPQAEQLKEYRFRPVLTAVAEAPEEGLKEGEKPVPVTEVTEELLRSGRAYFYSCSAYEVAEEIQGKSLLVTLTDPNGSNYRYESGWIYSPDYMAEDIWYLPLNDTRLTDALNANGYPAGVYRMAFYVDGDLGDAFEFELK